MSYSMQGHPRWTGHSKQFWQNVVHWRRKWQTTPWFASRIRWTVQKDKKIWQWKMSTPPQPRSVGVQYVTAEEQRAVTNSSRENEAAGTKQKSCSLVDVSGGEGKFRHCKEPYCIGSWNIRSMNQGRLDVVKKDIAWLNIDILGIYRNG